MSTDAPGPRSRLEMLDALRGVAALAVLLQHGAELLWDGYARWSIEVFRPGEWGVFVFFLVSGFVIPLSVERRRDPVSFWIGRAHRLYPLYWAVLATALVLGWTGLYPMDALPATDPGWHILANVTMVQNFLGSGSIVGAAWSLAYEMVFYLFITVLLLARIRGGATRTTLLTLAASSTLGVLIPPTVLSKGIPGGSAVLTAGGLAAAALVVVIPRLDGNRTRIAGGAVVTALVLLLVNQSLDLWFSLLLFATIGCGWVYHEAHRGRVDRWAPLAVSALTVGIATYHLGRWVIPHPGEHGSVVTWHPDALTFAVAHLTFALVYLGRRRPVGAPLRWLGRLSYSLYLVHAVVVHSVHPFPGNDLATLTGWVTLSLAVSALTQRWIEQPAQEAGHRLRRRWEARSSTRRPPSTTAPPPSDPGRDPQPSSTSAPASPVGSGQAGANRPWRTLRPEWAGSPSSGSTEISTTSNRPRSTSAGTV